MKDFFSGIIDWFAGLDRIYLIIGGALILLIALIVFIKYRSKRKKIKKEQEKLRKMKELDQALHNQSKSLR